MGWMQRVCPLGRELKLWNRLTSVQLSNDGNLTQKGCVPAPLIQAFFCIKINISASGTVPRLMFACWQCGSADTTERIHTHIKPSLGWHSEKTKFYKNLTAWLQRTCHWALIGLPALEVQSSIFIIHPLICSTAGFNWASVRQSVPIINKGVNLNVTDASMRDSRSVPLLVLVIGQPLLWRTSSLWTVFLRTWGWMDALF